MILSPEDAAMFYRAWGALLTWVNDQRRIIPSFPRPTPERPLDALRVNQIRTVLWAEDGLRERFLAEGASELASAERELIASWAHRVHGKFIVFRHLQKHSIFMSGEVYGVVGLYSTFEEMIPYVPMFVEATLLPFRDVIITDGILTAPGVQISFGGGARRIFGNQYSAARKAAQIRTALPWLANPLPAASSEAQKPARQRKSARRLDRRTVATR